MSDYEDKVSDLIEVQENYIRFLGDCISKTAVYLEIHHMGASDEDVKKGIQLRTEIERCKKELKDGNSNRDKR